MDERLVLVLHLAYAFVPLGFFVIALVPLGLFDSISALHVFTVGGIGLMTLAVMSRATRGHTGTALSARMAVLHARGEMKEGETLTAVSLIGSTFTGRILGTTTVGDRPAILPEISGRGWITGIHQHMLDPSDPWPEGYRLTDTWGAR